ncbi:uncharacterized protein LOC113301602 isoform X1 [Papaver somniferum]|uniref:uncharacterized protein LOC113301602 isoform X1 n=1 Tax=Papaver somniferum TaxID=3469 RepID=UPI000E700C3C|nr:uncharacterized protein LOC113301602 isoform X1 [Papaver somniferum]
MPQTDQPSPSSPTHQSNPPPPNSRVLDPYVIHPSDNPATVLFSPLLQGDNYGAWIKGITKALNANGKLGFVDGSLPPSEDDLTHRCWKRYDDLVGSWLLNSVHPDIRASCLYAASSYAIRKDFQVRFCISNALILFHLKSAIASIRQESMPVSIYYTKIKTLWDQYDSLVASTEACICGAGKHMLERLERDRAMEFLQGLHDRFSNLRSQILTMEPFPTAFHIFNIVQQEEEQQNITASPVPTIESAALNTSKHFASSSRPPASQNKRQRPHCDYCNRHGHVRDKCYKMHGFPTTTNKFPVAAVSTSMPPDSTTIQPAIPALSADQYARLLALINPPNESAQIEHRANFAGPSHETSDWSG